MRIVDRNGNTYTPPRPRMGLDRPTYRWRSLSWLLLACAIVTCLVAWNLS